MAAGAGSLRGAGSARITFFVFLDIITAVTGIFILVTLLLVLRAGDGQPVQGDANANPAASLSPANQMLEATLATRLDQLEKLAAENHKLDLELSTAETTPDAVTLREEVSTLRAALARARAAAAHSAADTKARSIAASARDDAAGLTANRAQIQQAKARVAQLEAENADKRQQSEALEREVRSAEVRLLAARNRGKNRLWLVPELPATSKAPLLVVVAAVGAETERFNQPDSHVTLKAADGVAAFKRLLANYKRLDDYVVFYVRPSGIDLFEQYRDAAREAGFEVGYDALEENRELIFGTRTD